MRRCLSCYKALLPGDKDFHPSCSRKIFNSTDPPELPYSEGDLESLAQEVIRSKTAVTGVQSKLSLHLSKMKGSPSKKRFTIVGLWGTYILKPPGARYDQLPEVEDLTMHLAGLAGIKTVPHSLIRMASGKLAYLTRRIDRNKEEKFAMEDMCQLSGRMTEHKYHGSYEQIAYVIGKYSALPGLDIINFAELVLFSFLTGNADMHLKNFSLIEHTDLGMVLAPAYDLVNTALVNPKDPEELALTLNGKKRKITRADFSEAMTSMQLSKKIQDTIFRKMNYSIPVWLNCIDESFLSDDYKVQFKEIILTRAARLDNNFLKK